MDIFIRSPVLAFLPAILFAAAFVHLSLGRGRRSLVGRLLVLGSCLSWIFYGRYEQTVPRDANIRVDLLLIYPALLIVSAIGVFAYLSRFARRNAQQEPAEFR